MSLLIEAVLSSDWDGMKRAIAAKNNVNERDGSMTSLLWAIMRGDVSAVRILLENGADPNLSPEGPSSCPLWSAEDDFGYPEIAKLLIEHGATKLG
jgi:ankyrin repeat protein